MMQQNNFIIQTEQESFAARPAHKKLSTIPPGAAAPYFTLHSLFDQIGIDTFCSIAGCGPP